MGGRNGFYSLFSMEDIASLRLQKCTCLERSRLEKRIFIWRVEMRNNLMEWSYCEVFSVKGRLVAVCEKTEKQKAGHDVHSRTVCCMWNATYTRGTAVFQPSLYKKRICFLLQCTNHVFYFQCPNVWRLIRVWGKHFLTETHLCAKNWEECSLSCFLNNINFDSFHPSIMFCTH